MNYKLLPLLSILLCVNVKAGVLDVALQAMTGGQAGKNSAGQVALSGIDGLTGTKLSNLAFAGKFAKNEDDFPYEYRSPSSSSGMIICFPETANVLKHDGLPVPITSLKRGIRLHDFMDNAGSKFTIFLHKNKKKEAEFIRLSTSSGSLTLSPNHYLFTARKNQQGELKIILIKASDVQESVDNLVNVVKKNFEPVTKIERGVIAKGVYAPMTKSTRLTVDNYAVSSFASVNGFDETKFNIARIVINSFDALRIMPFIIKMLKFNKRINAYLNEGIHPICALLLVVFTSSKYNEL